jgi:hypothetical protein
MLKHCITGLSSHAIVQMKQSLGSNVIIEEASVMQPELNQAHKESSQNLVNLDLKL